MLFILGVVQTMTHKGRGHSFQESVLLHLGTENQTQVFKIGSNHLHLLSHLTGPLDTFIDLGFFFKYEFTVYKNACEYFFIQFCLHLID